MFCSVYSGAIWGINAYPVSVEADVSNGLPGFSMVGYLASEVKEAQERVRTAIKNSGFMLPSKRVTVNLSPANIRKDGTGFDLAIAIAVLTGYGLISQTAAEKNLFVGELGLNGEIKPVSGALVYAILAREKGMKRFFLPRANAKEASSIPEVEIIGVSTLKELTALLMNPHTIQPEVFCEKAICDGMSSYSVDFSEVAGQLVLRRAVEIAASGMHHILLIGPAGSGKSMVAERIPTIMPPLTYEENLEISKIYSICGLLSSDQHLLNRRPFRTPHHTISPNALAGGGSKPKPGEISLATKGVLFLDELPEFSRESLEILRQPLEKRKITISRVQGTCDFPAEYLLVAAMNPCPCGYYPDRSRCRCSEGKVARYLGKISGPLLDRMDICVEAAPVSYGEMRQNEMESSAVMRSRVERLWELQKKRFFGTGIRFNSEMGRQHMKQYCSLKPEDEAFLDEVLKKKRLSARACVRILRVSRTIADMEGKEKIEKIHLSEALGYRIIEEQYWGKGL